MQETGKQIWYDGLVIVFSDKKGVGKFQLFWRANIEMKAFASELSST